MSRTGDSGHLSYVTTIIGDMIAYEYEEGEFYETGDKMIYSDGYIDPTNGKFSKRIFVKAGTMLYRGTDGVEFRKLAPAAGVPGLDLLTAGPVQNSKAWAMVLVYTLADGPLLLYVKSPAWSTVKPA